MSAFDPKRTLAPWAKSLGFRTIQASPKDWHATLKQAESEVE